MSVLSDLKTRQQSWARSRGQTVDRAGYFASPAQNLPWLTDAIRKDFDEADGHEFGVDGSRGKIAALHSSSALAVNFFGYWSMRESSALAGALGLTSAIQRIRFERKYPTGVGSRAPNLDVLLELASGSVLAIESKFCEPFSSRVKKPVQDKYFPAGRRMWSGVGLDGVQRAAQDARTAASGYTLLDAPQLLKHMLGLGTQTREWHLALLWYSPSSEVEIEMRNESDRFRKSLGVDASRFNAMTYQALWAKLSTALSPAHREYSEYLQSRYFERGA